MDSLQEIKLRIAFILGSQKKEFNLQKIEQYCTEFCSKRKVREWLALIDQPLLLDELLLKIIQPEEQDFYSTQFIKCFEPILKGDYFINLNDDESYGEVQECNTDSIEEWADSDWTDNCYKVQLHLCLNREPVKVIPNYWGEAENLPKEKYLQLLQI